MIIQPMTFTLNGGIALPHLGVIRVQGPDARSFLQGQLTQDFALLAADQARLAAFCSAKGRMQASFIGFADPAQDSDAILLVCGRDLLAPTLKRLSMFVMRAKAKLTDASDELAVWGIAGSGMRNVTGSTDVDLVPWALRRCLGGSLVSLYPASGQARGLWVGPSAAALADLPALDADLWAWSEVRSGVATLSAPLVDAFVPQMLNYESIGGVNFKKGCYPGQEVVARSQFRGTLKRRTYGVHAQQALTVGQEVFHSSDADQPCGTVVQVALAPEGGADALVSMQVSAATDGALHVGGPQGPTLEIWPLPYLLMADV